VGGRRRASCHVANVVGAGAPHELVALVAAQWWRWCGCRCGRRGAWALSRINIRVVPPPTVRGLQDASILVGPESPMRADRIVSTKQATGVVVVDVPHDDQVVPVVPHVPLKHVATFWTDVAGRLA